MGYGQSYYTLRSIFMDGIPPPEIKILLRVFTMKDIPLGDLSGTNPAIPPDTSRSSHPVEVEIPEKEKVAFDLWLRQLWQEKDDSITRISEVGSFIERAETFEIPVKLRQRREILDAFCCFLPAATFHLWRKLRR